MRTRKMINRFLSKADSDSYYRMAAVAQTDKKANRRNGGKTNDD